MSSCFHAAKIGHGQRPSDCESLGTALLLDDFGAYQFAMSAKTQRFLIWLARGDALGNRMLRVAPLRAGERTLNA